MRDAGCGMQDAGYGMRDAGCGMQGAGMNPGIELCIRHGCGMRTEDAGMYPAADLRIWRLLVRMRKREGRSGMIPGLET